MSERYNPEEIKRNLDGIMECHLEFEGGPEMADQALRLMPSLYAVSEKDAMTLYENIGQLGKYMAQMGLLLGQMQQRMDEMEARQAKVTISHGDVKRIQQLIRLRADELCGKYGLSDRESVKALRAAIRKDVLKRWGVKDLHDIPDAALNGVQTAISGWVNIRLVMERRAGG